MATMGSKSAYLRMMEDLDRMKREREEKERRASGYVNPGKSYLEQRTERIVKSNNDRNERLRRQQEELQEQQRRQRVLSQYQANRMQPAGWMNGGPAAQLQAGLNRMQQAKEEQGKKTPGFQDWSMASNLLDPNSKVSALISQRPQKEQDYWQGVREQMKAPAQKNTRADALLKPQSIGDRMQKKQADMDALMAAAKPEEKKDIWKGYGEPKAEEPKTEAPWTGRPADYEQHKEEYDRQLWDEMHGAGSYDAIDRRSVNWNRMNREIERQWNLRDARAEAQAASGMPFDQQSAQVQQEIRDSGMNQAYRDYQRKMRNMQEAESGYNAAMFLLNQANENLGSWMGDKTPEYMLAMNPKNANVILQAVENARIAGLGNQTGDVDIMNAEGRNNKRWSIQYENKSIEKQIENYKKEWETLEQELQDLNIMRSGYQWGPTDIVNRYGDQYRAAYEKYLKENNLEGNDQVFAQFILDESDRREEELDSRLKEAEARLEGNNELMDRMDRLDEMDNLRDAMMDQNARKAKKDQLTSEISDLEAQLAENNASGTSFAQRDIERKKIEKELQKKREQLEMLDNLALLDDDVEDDATFHAEWDRGQNWEAEEQNKFVRKPNGKMTYSRSYRGPQAEASVHGVYSYINGGSEYEYWQHFDEKEIDPQYQGAMAMLPAEKEQFNKLYNDAVMNGREPAEAQAFLDALQPYLNQRLRTFEELRNRQMARTSPVSASIGSAVSGMLSLPMAAATMIGRATGAKWTEDPYSGGFALARYQGDVEDQVAKDLGETGGFFYKAGMSAVKNFLRGLPFAGAGHLAGTVGTLTEFFGEAYYTSYQQKLEQTGNPDEAGLYAFTDAAISTFFEVASVERMFSDPSDLLQYLLQVGGAEMSEEFFEGVFSPYIHELIDGSNEWKDNAKAIIQAGGYEDENGNWIEITEDNANLAYKKALQDYNNQVAESVLSAGISTLGPAGFGIIRRNVRQNNETRDIGKTVLNKNVTRGMSAKEVTGERFDAFRKLNEAAQQLPEGSEARSIADRIAEDIRRGKKINFKKTGRMVRAIMGETNEQIGQVAQDVLGDTLKEQLVASGVKAEDADTYSRVLQNAITSGEMTPEAMLVLSANPKALELWKEVNRSEDVQSARAAQSSVMELLGADYNTKESDVAGSMENADWLREEDEELRTAEGERTGDPAEVVANGKIGKIVGFEVKEYKEGDTKTWRLQAKVQYGGETEAQSVDMEDVRAIGENGGKLLQFLRNENGQSIGENAARELLRISATTKNIAGAVTDAINIAMEAYGLKKTKVTNLSTAEEKAVRAAVEADLRAEDEAAAKNAKALKPGQGVVTFDGQVYGSKGFAEKLGGVSKQIRDEANYVAHLMKSVGMDVEFYYDASEKGSANQGAFIGGRGIRINLAGTFSKDGTHRSAVATTAHESLHWLRANSPEAYRQMRAFILNNLERVGMDVQSELRRVMDNYKAHGEHLTMGGAIEEIVAMANERVLTNEKLISELQEEDPRLYGKVKRAVQRVVNMLRGVRSEAEQTSSRYAKKLDGALDEIAKAWKLMLNEAKGAETGTAAENGKTSHSLRDEDYMAAVNSGDMETAQRMVDEAAKAAGYTEKAYHGTDAFGFTEFDMEQGQNTIFVAYTKDVAGTYTSVNEIREIKRPAPKDYDSLSAEELAEYAADVIYENEDPIDEGYYVWDIKLNPESNESWGEIFDITWEKYDAEEDRDISYVQTVTRSNLITMIEARRNKQGIYDLYTKPGNQLVVNLDGDNWNRIPWAKVVEATNGEAENWTGKLPYEKLRTRQVAAMAKQNGYDSVRLNNIVDHGGRNLLTLSGKGDVGIFFNPTDVKSADTVTYDGDGNVIPPSERFNSEKTDIRWSIQDNEIRNEDGDVLAEVLPGNTITKYSYQTWMDEDIESLTKQLITQGFKKKDVEKWIRDVNGVAAMIAANRDVLDYDASPYFRMLKNNQEYVKTLDASTLCAKRLLYQGIFNEIQSMLPNTPLMPQDLIKLINMMKEKGHVTPCGFCYVESRRKMLGKYAKQWLDSYQGENKPQLKDVTTTDGLEALRKNNPEAYDSFIEAMKAKGSANPKVVETRTAYRGEIREMTDGQIRKVKEIGGLRVQSFSDFEVIHMIDMMQAVLDMAAMDLTSQAYTKVPEFAAVFGDTGMKINLSLVGKGTGLNEKGELVFDDVEGMPWRKAMDLRTQYSKNVGTILVGINEAHIIAAMGDDRIDFIIPFHKSGWNKRELTQINGLSSYKDFTRWQNEKRIGSWNEKGVKTIPNKTSKISNFGPVNPGQKWDGQNGYWDFSKSGEENARVYLQLCKEDGRVPKFANFLEYDGEGGYRLPDGNDQRSRNIRKGYWKLLIDFKMYDNNGKGSPQTTVKPVFNMDAAREILENYDENARTLPTDHELAREYVKEYKAEHPGQKMFSMRDDTDYDVRQWMETVPEWSLQTEAEKQLLSKYKSLQMKQRLDRERMRKIDSDLLKLEAQLTEERTGRVEAEETMENALESAGVSVRDGHWLQKDGKIIGKINADGTIGLNKGVEENVYQTLRAAGFGFTNKKGIFRPAISAPQNADGKPTITALLGKSEAQRQRDALLKRKQDLQETMDEQEVKLAEITKDEGFGRMMYQQQKVLDDLQSFGTQRELMDYVARMEKKAQEVAARIEENRKATEALEKGDVVKRFRELLGTTTAEKTAAELKKEFSSTWTAKQIQAYLNPIILKMKSGQDFQQDVETLAGILVSSDSRNRYEALEDLRGLVITIGKGAQRELKAQNSSLKEVRARLAGTGIQVKYGDRSTLEADIEDLRAEYPMIPELGDEKDALGNFLNWVDSMKSASAGMEFYDQRIAEAMAVITGKAAGAAKGIYMPNDPKAQQQVLAIMDFVKGLSAETAEAQKALADIAAQMGEMQKAGVAATNRATTLMRDVNVAIDYYQKIGKIAADEAKQKKQSAVIEQLKSKHAQEIVKNNEEWRALIQRDKDARAQLDENRKMTRQINTNLKRTFNLLKNPKGLQNIPEYMQGLAREVISKFVDNDLGRGARFIQATQKELTEWRRILDAWEKQNGKFDRTQLGAMDAENVKADVVLADLDKITEGMKQLNAWKIYGKNKLDALQQRGAIIEQIRDAVSEIYTAIRAEGEVQAGDRRVAVEDAAHEVAKGTGGKKYREWTGFMGQKMNWLHKAIVSGNMTPEYYFRMLGNKGLSDLWENYHWAENKNGLELKKAKDRLAQIAEEYGYKNWDMKQKIKLNLQSGEVEITLGQMMSLWATWQREKTLGPEMSSHLTHGGFYADVDLRDGLLGRATVEKRAHRVTEEDMDYVLTQLTVDQMNFIDAVVKFMSNDMSELGNAASMQAYGIKLYKESYYFPFQMWDGVKSRKSNDAGGAAAANDRAFHPSFSKSRQHGANNAVMIGDFMQVATDHIAGMINYATMGLANEYLQKVLNAQTAELYDTKRNTRALIEEAYGREAAKYLADLQAQLNGGAVRIEKTIYDKMISLFRKNAVAGSLSVALQQPLSYIRAAMMINPKYLTQAVMKEYWKGSYQELIAHSGVAVIKDMGKFDMNAGQTAREYLAPEGMVTKGKKVWTGIGDAATMLPERMDAWTWTRMWVAVKAEQHAEHPEMDMKGDEFLDMCAKRFNDIMRRTQVYDSTLVRSANMRSQNPFVKSVTSFMAEPTLTLNVLADSIRMAKEHEKGGAGMVGKAAATFLLSAVLQAAVKGLMGSGRNPDKKKTWLENFLYRFSMAIMSEANPLSMIPGYSDMVTLLKEGKLEDDAMGAAGKLITAFRNTMNILSGESDNGLYRDLEDSVAQIVQIFTNIPAKNLMRDGRAMWNWFIEKPYAQRESDMAVIRYQTEQAMASTDSLLSALLKDAGFKTTNAAYYERIYQAKKAGDDKAAQDMIDYLLHGKGVKQEDINSGVTKAAKADDSISVDEKTEMLGGDDATWWKLDRDAYKKETGKDVGTGYYYRLADAINSRKSDAIKAAVKQLKDHGISNDKIKGKLSDWKKEYLNANGNEKVQLKNALIMAYKALGYSDTEANEIINKWK